MKKNLDKSEREQLAALQAMADDEIDTQDIPEAPEANWDHAHRPGLYKPLKKSVTMRLDLDVIAWFKEHSDGGYQTEINRTLRKHMLRHEARVSRKSPNGTQHRAST
jgi:uncharacterized protein (DUF4415 family)